VKPSGPSWRAIAVGLAIAVPFWALVALAVWLTR
jgi:hypothetical protein